MKIGNALIVNLPWVFIRMQLIILEHHPVVKLGDSLDNLIIDNFFFRVISREELCAHMDVFCFIMFLGVGQNVVVLEVPALTIVSVQTLTLVDCQLCPKHEGRVVLDDGLDDCLVGNLSH